MAEKVVAGKISVKRNRFVKLTGATKTVNRELETKARALAGIKSYVTNIAEPTPEFVIDAYHRLGHIEKSFRMAKVNWPPIRSTTAPATRSKRT
jgi:Zn-dependent alcohol dehydrogenase